MVRRVFVPIPRTHSSRHRGCGATLATGEASGAAQSKRTLQPCQPLLQSSTHCCRTHEKDMASMNIMAFGDIHEYVHTFKTLETLYATPI